MLLQGRIISELARKTPQAIHRTLECEETCLVRERDGDNNRGAAVGATQHEALVTREQGRTKRSLASSPKVAFLGDSFIVADMSINWACLLNSASNVCRKGLRDMGRLVALVGVWRAGEGMAGDVALLRNGFLELSSSVRAGEGRRSVQIGEVRLGGIEPSPLLQVKQAVDKDRSVPGIDGSANMMAWVLATLRSGPNDTRLAGVEVGERRWASDRTLATGSDAQSQSCWRRRASWQAIRDAGKTGN